MANAGIAPMGTVRSTDPDAFERTIEINLLGVWRTVRACLPHVIERQGYVLVIASLAAAMHAPGMAAYAASKAGAEAFGNSLRQEVKHLGVDVGVGYFSFIDTDMVRGADAHPTIGGLRHEIARGPIGKTYPLSDAGQAIADGIEKRRRWVVVPPWAAPCWCCARRWRRSSRAPRRRLRRRGRRLFEADVAERGAEAASKPVGPGGEAAAREATPAG